MSLRSKTFRSQRPKFRKLPRLQIRKMRQQVIARSCFISLNYEHWQIFLHFRINLLCSNHPTGLFQTMPKHRYLWIKTLRQISSTFSHLSTLIQTMWLKWILLNILRYNVLTVISVCVTDVLNVSMITLCANRIFCKRLKIVFWRISPYEEG